MSCHVDFCPKPACKQGEDCQAMQPEVASLGVSGDLHWVCCRPSVDTVETDWRRSDVPSQSVVGRILDCRVCRGLTLVVQAEQRELERKTIWLRNHCQETSEGVVFSWEQLVTSCDFHALFHVVRRRGFARSDWVWAFAEWCSELPGFIWTQPMVSFRSLDPQHLSTMAMEEDQWGKQASCREEHHV